MVFCTYCGQEFSRAEHLDRHVLTHTNVKPFKCSTCHFSFKRRDLLQRHYQLVHKEADEASPSELEANAPQRRPIACTICAKAKTKCDKGIPSCSRCISKGLVCESRSTRRSSEAVYRQAKRQLSNNTNRRSQTSLTGDMSEAGESGFTSMTKHDPMSLDGHPNFPPTSEPMMFNPSAQFSSASPISSHSTGSPLSMNAPSLPMMPLAPLMTSNTPSQFLDQASLQQSPEFIPSAMDQYLQMPPTTSDPSMESQYYMNDGMQLLDLGFTDYPPLMPPDATSQMLFRSAEQEPCMSTTRLFPDLTPPMSRPPSSSQSTSGYSYPFGGLQSPSAPRSLPSSTVGGYSAPDQHSAIAVQDGWPCFQSDPPSETPLIPKTGRIYLEGLDSSLKNHDAWRNWAQQVDVSSIEHAYNGKVLVEPFGGRARESLMMMTHSILNKAQDAHDLGASDFSRTHTRNSSFAEDGFIVLPAPEILEYFLKAYTCRFEPYYPMITAGTFSATELMEASNKQSPSLLLLLMIAQGAMATSTPEARYLSSGLTEACRLSLFNFVDKDVLLSRDLITLRSALLFTNLAAWSGDKWHMDIAVSQRGMYTSMLKQSGLLNYRQVELPVFEGLIGLEIAWKTWKDFESVNRLVYSWVTVDQELSLFHDTPPRLSITELNAAMPDADILWQARSADEWSTALEQVYGPYHAGARKNPPSLYEVFRRFMNREILDSQVELTPLQLRLILHPLQALVCHLHQCLSCFAESSTNRQARRLVTQLEEVQSLLQQWYALCCRTMQKATSFDPVTCANLVVYHLISLNTMTSFPDIERLARREMTEEEWLQTTWARLPMIEEGHQVRFHCGQILRLVRQMPDANKPLWWSAAIYRVALTLWATGIANAGANTPMSTGSISAIPDGTKFAIDRSLPEDTAILRYLRYRDGIPVLSRRNGSVMPMDAPPADMLGHCLEVLEDDDSSIRLVDGIKNRLARLYQRVQSS
ncbi:hypothetical protein M501DRAFT_937797 [Patellaria atrata CBS 101060]|uniref:Transcription factor Cmr1 n=1 Tax=Patellaria atrata CBS 101060 TaxID=1346257 RepID=A0A9P4S6W5_9PEZI|nr:hypothetical protein M501DRAFT_937797 [Patellaria atrata CBS 101060]